MFFLRIECFVFFFFQAEDGIRDYKVTGVQTCALPISWINEVYVNSSQLYYPKGSLLGMLLDISIRDATDNAHSLDDVMRALFTRYYRQGKGFSTSDLLAELR